MSSEAPVRARNVGKCYQMYATPRHRLLQSLLRGRRQFFRPFWALRGVTFDVRPGETLGIVGRNGSGKSTLLQILCGTLTPTEGTFECDGKIAALLELGAGFNPEFTGRENVYLSGALLGLKRAEIDRRFDEIVAFSEIADFIEAPVKTYSSGMYVRLAFAVAVSVEPDILVVDEALSVGDEAFQRKCFERIRQFQRGGGTLLFVSHSAGLVLDLCDKAVLLDNGEMLAAGTPKQVVGHYHRLLATPPERLDDVRAEIRSGTENTGDAPPPQTRAETESIGTAAYLDPGMKPRSTIRYGPDGASIEVPRIETEAGEPVNLLVRGEVYRYRYDVVFENRATGIDFGMLIKSVTGLELGGAVSAPELSRHDEVAAGERVSVDFTFRCALQPGAYFLNAGVRANVQGAIQYLDRIVDAVMFRVLHEANNPGTGIVDFDIHCHTSLEP